MPSNPQPSSILNRRITFATVNNTNGNVIPEPFRVFGPYAQGVQVTRLRTGNKAVIPLSNETGEGAFFLKLHFPNTSSTSPTVNRAMYITFCVKRSAYDDGYQDFTQAVTVDYMNALKKWIDNGRTPSTSGYVRYRKLSFTAYGHQTSRVNNAVSFEVRFNYRGADIGGTFANNPNIVRTPGRTTSTAVTPTTTTGTNNNTNTPL